MSSTKKKLLLVTILLSVIILVQASPLRELITVQNLKNARAGMESAVRDHYLASVFLFILLYVLATALSIPGASLLTLAGGFLYGPLPATLYVNIGATTGAVLAFFAVRYVLGTWVQSAYQRQLEKFNAEMHKNGSSYLLTLRLIPVFPFFLVNLLSGLTNVPPLTFAWTTSVGIIPGTAAYAFAGQQLASLNSFSDVLSPKLMTAFGALALLALLPALRNRRFWGTSDKKAGNRKP